MHCSASSGSITGPDRILCSILPICCQRQGYDWIASSDHFRFTERVTAASLDLGNGGGLQDLALATHGVNNGQAVKTGPVWSLVSGSAAYRNAARKLIDALDHYHGLPNGMFSCDEHLAGLSPSQGSELCTVVEYMFSLEQSLAISGDPLLRRQARDICVQCFARRFQRCDVGASV